MVKIKINELAEKLGYKNTTAFVIHGFMLLVMIMLAVYMLLYSIPYEKTRKICADFIWNETQILDQMCAYRQMARQNITIG